MNKTIFDVRQLECWNYNGEWTENTSYNLGMFQTSATSAKQEKRAFVRYLNKQGITFFKNRTLIEFDGDCYTVIDRKTKEPLFVAIPHYPIV